MKSARGLKIKGKNGRNVFDGEQLRGLLFGSDIHSAKKLSLLQQLILKIGRTSQLLRNISALRFLSKIWMPLSKNIVVIGGDLVGLELAEFLVERGRTVKVLEPSAYLGPNLSIVRRSRFVHMLKERGVDLLTNVMIKEICDQIGVDFFTISTDLPMETALLELIQSRASSGRSVKRATQVRGAQ